MPMRSRLMLLLLLLAPIQATQAQTAMTEAKSPSLEVLGLYSFSAATERYARFIEEEIDSLDPANFSEDEKALFRRLGRGADLQPFTDEDRREREDELHFHMVDAAVLEVLVSHADARLNIGEFLQPDPSQKENFWQVAWNEKFLTADGETSLEIPLSAKLPEASSYRVVFVIHFWKPDQPLRSSYGELPLPAVQPLPDRLWRLTPYKLPD